MSLSKKQRKFTLALNHLLEYGYNLGYEFTLGDAYRADTCTHGHPRSTHRYRLAQDLNLFMDDRHITDGSHHAWTALHDYWDALGGSERIENDMNHFSFEHNDIR